MSLTLKPIICPYLSFALCPLPFQRHFELLLKSFDIASTSRKTIYEGRQGSVVRGVI